MSIDEVSKTLGQLEATMEQHGKVHTVMLEKLDKINDKLTIQNGSIAKAHARIDEAVTKKDALKAILVFGGLGGVSGAGILKALGSLFGGQ